MAAHDIEVLAPIEQIPTQLPPQQPGLVQMPGPLSYPQEVIDPAPVDAQTPAAAAMANAKAWRSPTTARMASMAQVRPSDRAQAASHDSPRAESSHGVAGGGEGGEGAVGGSGGDAGGEGVAGGDG